MSNICAIIGIVLMIMRMIYIFIIKKNNIYIGDVADFIVAYDLSIILFELIATILTNSGAFLACTIIWIIVFILDTL